MLLVLLKKLNIWCSSNHIVTCYISYISLILLAPGFIHSPPTLVNKTDTTITVI